jgi:hypothetical protein
VTISLGVTLGGNDQPSKGERPQAFLRGRKEHGRQRRHWV